MENEISKLGDDIKKELFKKWGVKKDDYKTLIERSNDRKHVCAVFSGENSEVQRLLITIASLEGETNTDVLSSSMGYKGKKLPDFFEPLDQAECTGFIYMLKKRGKLNRKEDKIFMFENIREHLLNIIYPNVHQMLKHRSDVEYNKTLFKKHNTFLKNLFEYGGYSAQEVCEEEVTRSVIKSLVQASILDVGLISGKPNKVFYFISNKKVKEEMEKKDLQSFDSVNFYASHYSIVSDIEKFIYAVEENRIRRLKSGELNFKVVEGKNIEPSPLFMDFDKLYKIAKSLDIIYQNSMNELLVNYPKKELWMKMDVEEKLADIQNNFLNHEYEDISTFYEIINYEGEISIAKLCSHYNKQNKSRIHSTTAARSAYALYLCGAVELGIDDNRKIIAVRSVESSKEEATTGSCIMNSNFELMMIGHKSFDSGFIYLLSIYSDVEDENEILKFHFTEESVMRGKHFSTFNHEISVDKLIEMMRANLKSDLPKNIETTIKRWYDKYKKGEVYFGVTLIKLDDKAKMEELTYIGKKEGFNVKPMCDGYAIIDIAQISVRKLVKTLRKQKIDIDIVKSADDVKRKR